MYESEAAVTRTAIASAAERIAPYIRRTPVMVLDRGAFGGDFVPVLKLELHQRTGTFKARGAFNNLLSRPVPASGVAAASGGNHGIAVAYAAKVLGLPAAIFVPEIASKVKVEAIRACGANVTVGGARFADAAAVCEAFVAKSGALFVHPYGGVETIAGQGTLALEWQEQCAKLDTVLVAAGGGGLVVGIGAWWRGGVKVVAVEPEGSRALHAALEANAPVDVTVESVAADSLGARNVGPVVFELAKVVVDHVALVTDASIRSAQALLWRELRIATEPGGAAALAALLSGAYKPSPGERVGILVCGGNVDLRQLAEVAL